MSRIRFFLGLLRALSVKQRPGELRRTECDEVSGRKAALGVLWVAILGMLCSTGQAQPVGVPQRTSEGRPFNTVWNPCCTGPSERCFAKPEINRGWAGTIASASQLKLLSTLDLGSPALSVALSRPYMFVICGTEQNSWRELKIFRVDDPSNPQMVASLDRLRWAMKTMATNAVAYVAAGSEGVYVVDLKQQGKPVLTDTLSLEARAHDVAVQWPWLFVAFGERGCRLYDIRKPEKPVLKNGFVDFCEVPPPERWAFWLAFAVRALPSGVVVLGHCPAAWNEDLRVLEVEPYTASLRLRSTFSKRGRFLQSIAGEGSYIYVVDTYNPDSPQLLIFGITDFALHRLSATELGGSVSALAASGGFAYVALRGEKAGIVVVDARNRSTPKLVGHFKPEVVYSTVDASGSIVAAVTGQQLELFRNPAVEDSMWNGRETRFVSLGRPYPNPFRDQVLIPYAAGNSAWVEVSVFDLKGRRVRLLVHGIVGGGDGLAAWDGTDDAGRPLPSGVYLVRLEAGRQVAVRKVVLVR